LQADAALAALELFDAKMSPILHQRTALAVALQQSLVDKALLQTAAFSLPAHGAKHLQHAPPPQLPMQQPFSLPPTADLAASPALPSDKDALTQLTSELCQNVSAENAAHNVMSDYICKGLLSPLQLAKAVAASYPFIPDVSAILRCVKKWGFGDGALCGR
jgi:hypothetical protein